MTEEAFTGLVRFDPDLRDRLRAALGGVPILDSGAGHDAGPGPGEQAAGVHAPVLERGDEESAW